MVTCVARKVNSLRKAHTPVEILKVVTPGLLKTPIKEFEIKIPQKVEVIHSSKHYIVVNKPPFVLSQQPDKKSWYKNHNYSPPIISNLLPKVLESENAKDIHYKLPVRYYTVQRLDSCVTGGIVLATDKYAAKMFSRNLREGGNAGFPLSRKYVAKVPHLTNNERFHHGLFKLDGAISYLRRVDENHFIVQLITGKKHQVRKLFKEALDKPIYNDYKYGGDMILNKGLQITLHCGYIKTQVGMQLQEHIIPIPEGFRLIWGESIDGNGIFGQNIIDMLRQDWSSEIKVCLKKLKQQEEKSPNNRLIVVT